MAAPPPPGSRDVVVLLVDDQQIIGEAVRRMLSVDDGIRFHFCRDPQRALETAVEVRPTVILQDLVMPGVDGLDLVRSYRGDERLRDVPVIVLSMKEGAAVKAEAFAVGANDYIVKLPDRLELLARVRHHSRGYVALVERNEAFAALQASQQMLANDLSSAVRYVRSLLPPPLREGAVRADWRFMPSAALGGDSFGYHALDDEHVAFYLLDVCGHGVGAALLSVSALNALRGGALPDADFRDPGSVLAGLNRAFPMERHNDMFFTAWYGVHHLPTRRLRWSGGGHPPAILRGAGRTQLLESDGPLIGAVEGLDYGSSEVEVPPGARLLIYSDGAFEVVRRDGSMWAFEEFVDAVTAAAGGSAGRLDALVAAARRVAGRDDFAADDVSLMEIEFE